MKINKQRNPYLRRISANIPHKYSYDIDSGKYFLHTDNQPDIEINKTGTLKPNFKVSFSGFANTKQRYSQAQRQPSFMSYIPDFKYHKSKSYYTPASSKFTGYAQYPYHISKQIPQHLRDQKQKYHSKSVIENIMMRKCQSQAKKQLKPKKNVSMILDHSMTAFVNPEEKERHFNLSFNSITESRPLPRNQKKSCYNYKCKHMKHFVFENKEKALQQSTNYSTKNSFSNTNTFGLSFHQSTLRLQSQQSKLIRKKN